MPEISIILPVYNGMKYLPQSVQSVLAQSWRDYELLIVDDCSNDGTWDYLQSLSDGRVRLFRNQQNKGLFPNLNFLVKQASAPLIKLWAQDDRMYPNCLAEIASFHREHPELGFSYTMRDHINEEGKIIEQNRTDLTPTVVSLSLHARIAFYTGSIAGNIANVTLVSAALEKVGLFNEAMKISADCEMWVRLAQSRPVGFIKKPLVQLRGHSEQLSRQEEFYLFHMLEDLQVYRYLMGYVSRKANMEGRSLLRNYKLQFYYTLMLKTLLQGKWRTAAHYAVALHRFDNLFILTFFYLKNKVLGGGQKNPAHLLGLSGAGEKNLKISYAAD